MHASAPRTVHEVRLEVAPGCTVRQALVQAGFPVDDGAGDGGASLTVAVWGRRASLDDGLADGDRVELVRPLRVDPKVARRERFVGQGARAAGLFAKRRPGSKAGY